ncbi:hypothetical protein ACFQV8_00495 [Pseudonocardia benzenivorans]
MSVGRSSLRVRVATSTTGPTAARPDAAAGGPDLSGGWRATTWIGAPAPGGLALPPAAPTRAWCYSPRGVHVDADHLVVADSGNHRVLIWHGVPAQDGRPADVVLGQPDGTTEGRAAGGRGPERGLNLPTGCSSTRGGSSSPMPGTTASWCGTAFPGTTTSPRTW